MALYTLTVDLLMKTGSFEKDAGKAARQLEQRMDSMQASAKRAGTAIGLALSGGLAAGGAAVVQWTKQVADLSVQYDRMASLSGTSSVVFQRMAAGANTVGVSYEKLADIYKDVQDKIGDYIQTGGGAMADFFENIAKRTGVTAEKFRKLSGPDALGLYFSSLEKANLSQSEMTFYMEALASDASALIPLLRNNSAGMKQWGDAAAAAGAIIDGKTSKATKRLKEVTNEAELAFQGLKVTVADQALPAFSEFAELLNDPGFRQGFGTIIDGLVSVTTKAAEAAAMVGGLTDILNQGFKPRDQKSYDGLLQERQRLAENVESEKDLASRARTGKARWWEGPMLGNSNSEENAQRWDAAVRRDEAELLRIDEALKQRRLADLAAEVQIIENGAPLPESALKPGAQDYAPTGNIDKSARDKAEKEADAARKRQRAALLGYNKDAAIAAGTIKGPLAEAEAKHAQRLKELSVELKAGNIAQAAYNTLKDESAAALARTTKELKKQQGAPQALLDTMSNEINMLGLIGPARERYRRELQNQHEMQQAINEANQAGAGINDALAASLMGQARAAADASVGIELYAAQMEAWADIGTYAINDVADAFADFTVSGLRDFEGLWDDLKDVAKQGVRDIARQLLQEKLVVPIQAKITDAVNGWGAQGGGMSWESVQGLFGGNGTAGGGQNLGNIAGLLSKGQGLFSAGAASSGASAGTLMGFGNNVAALTGGGAAAAGGSSAAAGAGAASSTMAAAVPIIGWVIAGMMKNAELFDEGWDIANGESWAGKIATAGAVGILDKAHRAVGLSDKTASILSGSSIHAKLFGRKAPQITGQGITGSYGFGGFEGESYADIKAKGGMFRSDKKWTQYAGLDSNIDRMFDMATRQVRGASTGLAKQLGVDLSQQLAGVKVTLGKLTLSADSTEAKEQLEAYMGDMTDRLFTEAVKAAGFGSQLDTYFEASDVFTALGASIELAVGNADSLGRALNGLEIEKVNKAVDYFQDLASVAGTDLATQIEKVTGLLGSYASLMADVSTQLLTGDLTGYQSQALSIERTYRQQVKAANDYAKALGLSGARAEDLAKIEALRATSMGKLQAQIEKDKKAISYGLSVSELSPLTDQEKLQETMRELERAVSGGDSSAAQAAAQATLGFGRNLYASGKDYNALYGQVTGLVDGMKVGNLDLEDGTGMGELAAAIEALPDNFSRAVFDLVVDNKGQAATTAAVQESNALLAQVLARLENIEASTGKTASTTTSSALRTTLNR